MAFLAYCLHVTLKARLNPLAPGLTPRAVLDKFAAIQMLDVHLPTTDGNCGNYVSAFWSAAMHGPRSGIHDYKVVPWHPSTTRHPDHWPPDIPDIGNYWIEARRSIEGKNWTAAAPMARAAVQLVARAHEAKCKKLKEEINDLADKGLMLPIMRDWAREVRELGNEGTHPKPGTKGTGEKDAKDVVEFLTFLMTVLYDLPKQIDDYRKRRV